MISDGYGIVPPNYLLQVVFLYVPCYNISMKEVKIQANSIYKEAATQKHRYMIYYGSAGSGKSVEIAQKLILRVFSESGRNLLCVRKAEITNRDSTLAELQKAINNMGLAQFFEVTYNPMRIKCLVNGNVVIFRGMKDVNETEKIKSITVPNGTLTDIWVEEATELTEENLDILDDRLRGILPKGLFYQIHISFNPVSASHWIKGKFFDRKRTDTFIVHSTYLDNRFIDEAYHERMKNRKIEDPDGYRIYGLGEWGTLRGQIFKNFTIENVSMNLQNYDDIAIGQDFGFSHANAILLLGYKDGDVYVIREIYEYEKHTQELIDIANANNLPVDIPMWADSAEPDRIKMWREAGYSIRGVKKESNSVVAQIDWLKQRKIRINPGCVNTIKEIQQWRWQFDSVNSIELDKPVGIFDDAMAALRYGIEGWRKDKTVHISKKW